MTNTHGGARPGAGRPRNRYTLPADMDLIISRKEMVDLLLHMVWFGRRYPDMPDDQLLTAAITEFRTARQLAGQIEEA